jgi:DNA adenine methylase
MSRQLLLPIADRDMQPPLQPLFRWPGGKRWLLQQLLQLVPKSIDRYYEPFLGAGALFFALRPAWARVSDVNSELISCYEAIRDDYLEVAAALAQMPRDEKSYYRIRSENPATATERAARLIYLTTLAFNGIYRVNKKGEFNVPYGGRTYGEIRAASDLALYARALSCANLQSCDFEAALQDARTGDVVYLDPPYTVAHSQNGFVKYNHRIFSWDDQVRLAATAHELSGRGCRVVASNAYHPTIARLYRGFRAIAVSRASVIAAHATHRRPILEYVFTNVE